MKSNDWFKYLFNSHHYFLLYQNRNDEEASQFYNLIKKNIELTKDFKVLDFCCGYGRLTKFFAKDFIEIKGVDLSEFFISKAKEHFAKENLKAEFQICDVRNFDEKEKYNLAVNFFTSFGYFTDQENEKTFSNLCNSVIKNGYVVIDYFNSEFVLKNLVEYEKFNYENSDVEIKRYIENNRVNKVIKIKSEEGEENYFEQVRIYTLEDFENLFKRNSFEIQKTFGDYSGIEFSKDSPRLIIFAKKV